MTFVVIRNKALCYITTINITTFDFVTTITTKTTFYYITKKKRMTLFETIKHYYMTCLT